MQMGEIVNYMQLDTTRMESVIGTVHVIWDGPLQVLVSVMNMHHSRERKEKKNISRA
jgi:hypothetical protein